MLEFVDISPVSWICRPWRGRGGKGRVRPFRGAALTRGGNKGLIILTAATMPMAVIGVNLVACCGEGYQHCTAVG